MIDPRDIEKWAWASPHTGTAKFVLICLSRFADWDTLECYPSQRRIAAECGISERSVRDAIKALRDAGTIQVTERYEARGRRTNLITLNAPHLSQPADSVRPTGRFRYDQPAESAGELSQRTTSEEHPRADALVLFPEEASEAAARPHDAGPAFEDFWREYPSKVGKGAAVRAWSKAIEKALPSAIVAAVQAQRRSERWLKGFVPNPATWLSQERWDDEVPGESPGLGGLPDWC